MNNDREFASSKSKEFDRRSGKDKDVIPNQHGRTMNDSQKENKEKNLTIQKKFLPPVSTGRKLQLLQNRPSETNERQSTGIITKHIKTGEVSDLPANDNIQRRVIESKIADRSNKVQFIPQKRKLEETNDVIENPKKQIKFEVRIKKEDKKEPPNEKKFDGLMRFAMENFKYNENYGISPYHLVTETQEKLKSQRNLFGHFY